jgi:Zn-dependent peptidase ImmA (M78 family)
MDLADCGSPTTLVAAILKHHPDMPRRVPVKDIARSVGIVDFKELDADGFEGGLTANVEKTRGIILTKREAPRRRRRFTIGHELGHFLIPMHHGTQTCSLGDMRESRRDNPYRRQEAEANQFSAGLLMPKPIFAKDMEALGSADVTHAKHLSDLYDTSMEATVNRYADLTSDICAFVFSKDGVVRYTRPTSDFPRLNVRPKSALPSGCATLKAPANDQATEWREQSGSMWLETEWGKHLPKVIEQCVVQSNGYRVTLLYIEPSEVEDVEDEGALNESWEIRFRGRR